MNAADIPARPAALLLHDRESSHKEVLGNHRRPVSAPVLSCARFRLVFAEHPNPTICQVFRLYSDGLSDVEGRRGRENPGGCRQQISVSGPVRIVIKVFRDFKPSCLVIILSIFMSWASVANSAGTDTEHTTHHPHPVHATSKRVRHPVNTASKIIHHPVHETSLFIHEATGTKPRHPKPE